jgi:hypothetical protein
VEGPPKTGVIKMLEKEKRRRAFVGRPRKFKTAQELAAA